MALAQAGRTPTARTPFFQSLRWQEAKWAYIFLVPNLTFFLAFTVYPVFASFYYSLNSWDLHTPMKFVGLGNYAALINDKIFRKVM